MKSATMARGILGFGLLSGTFTPETVFVRFGWRGCGEGFELPLIEQEPWERSIPSAWLG